jgi:magnesium chelatase family protein
MVLVVAQPPGSVSPRRWAGTAAARFPPVAATNPCPAARTTWCVRCDGARLRYLRRLSGPLLDRFDLRVGVARPGVDDLLQSGGGECTSSAAARVGAARAAAIEARGMLNSDIPASHLDVLAPLQPAARLMLRTELERERLTGRGYHRIRRVARTIADLEGDSTAAVGEQHVALALQLRVRMRVSLREQVA